ncbi:MAG: hypothetical protein NZ822_01100 [Patescibacteria group bacterium]|nr:hypothetical protein [Patescibacteria group bacterium]
MEAEQNKESTFARIRKNKFLRRLLVIILFIWLIFSVIYIGQDQLNKIGGRLVETGYRIGITDSVRRILEGSENCQTVRVFLENRERTLIDVKCVGNKSQTLPLTDINRKTR